MDTSNWQALTGQSTSHLCPLGDSGQQVHAAILPALTTLCDAATRAGIRITVCSGFRSFDRQLTIWNGKATGTRPVLDQSGTPLDMSQLSAEQQLFAILRWSAIPGCSRHHWGTDLDIYDAAAVPPDYHVQLTPLESDTVFAHLHAWLDVHLQACGFFRPYARDAGGIAPERWHISHRETASQFERQLDEGRMADWLAQQDIALKQEILRHWHTIFHRHVLVTTTRQDCAPT